MGLVEAHAGYVGGFDVVRCVIVLFREGDGDVLDAVFDAESLKEDDEVAEVFDVVVISFVSLDVTQEDYVIGEIVHAIGAGQNDNCRGECRVVRSEANAIAVLLVGQSGRLSAEVVGEIVLYIGECISQTLVGVWGLLGCMVYRFFFVACLVAEEFFYTGEEFVEVVGYFHFLLDLGFVCELSSLIFSSRRCFWSRARAVS